MGLGWTQWQVPPDHPPSPVQVEFCKSFGDPTKPRAWSKHAQKAGQTKQPPKDKDSVPPETKKVRTRALLPSNRGQQGGHPGGLGEGSRGDLRLPLGWFLQEGPSKTIQFRLPSPKPPTSQARCPHHLHFYL